MGVIIWLIVLSILYAILIGFQVETQKQLNKMNSSLYPRRNRPTLTREYLKSQGIVLTEEQYNSLAFLDVESYGKYEAYEIMRLLKVLELI